MNHKQRLIQVREFIIKSVPKLKYQDNLFGLSDREIHLNHLLYALDRKIGLWDYHPKYKPITIIEYLFRDCRYNFLKLVLEQDPFTIEFIYSILCKNERTRS